MAEQLSRPRCASPRLALHPGEAPTQDWPARLTASPADPARTPHQDDTRHKAIFSWSVLGEFSRLKMVLTLSPRRPHLPPPDPRGPVGTLARRLGPASVVLSPQVLCAHASQVGCSHTRAVMTAGPHSVPARPLCPPGESKGGHSAHRRT